MILGKQLLLSEVPCAIMDNSNLGFSVKNRNINVWFISQNESLELPILFPEDCGSKWDKICE